MAIGKSAVYLLHYEYDYISSTSLYAVMIEELTYKESYLSILDYSR